MSSPLVTAVLTRPRLTALDGQHPEWRPLLAVIGEALRESDDPRWMRLVPTLTHSGLAGQPLLDGAVIKAQPKFVGRWIRRILDVAAAAGTEVKPLTRGIASGSLDPLLFFEIALSHDVHRLDELGRLVRDDRGVLHALSPLIARPLLFACRRKWADRVPGDWTEGHCRICGRGPALAELRGLDGSRQLRCAGCGGEWGATCLRCPFCGEADHEQLGSLMSPESFERHAIDVCESCGRYVKTITTLTPIPPEDVVLEDLATLVLDLVAIERGYQRRAPRGVAVSVVAARWWLHVRLGL
jgi:FdhE protein